MTEAFVDTTIAVDALLKGGTDASIAKKALARYKRTLLPVYALKELKAGPLSHFVWLHNNLATFKSMRRAYEAIQNRGRQRYTVQTALQALSGGIPNVQQKKLVQVYGDAAKPDRYLADQHRLYLATKIPSAWNRRRKLVSAVVEELPCYLEIDLKFTNDLIDHSPTACKTNCCLPAKLKGRASELEALRGAIKDSTRQEDRRRSRVLREILVRPTSRLNNNSCRSIGDAYFALFAPPKAVILTTNVRDHEILAGALGKRAESP